MSTFTGTRSTYSRIPELQAQVTDGGQKTWVTRGANQVVAYSELAAGATIAEREVIDEYFCLVYTGAVTIDCGGESQQVAAGTLCIVPPGPSGITADEESVLVRVFTANDTASAELANNAGTYAVHPDVVAPLDPLPEPVGGYRLRTYAMADYPKQDGVLGRIFRTRNLMINVFHESPVARDPEKLTPHSHDDFEQISVTLAGNFVHHLRYPWTPNHGDWLDDEHEPCPSPAVVVIPATVVHTSQSVGTDPGYQIVDIFAPPRADFSGREGWVRNADEYPWRTDDA